MTLVREDEISLYVIHDGMTARPGQVAGYSHVYRMDSAELKAGDKVNAYHRRGSPLIRLKLSDGTTLFWHGV